MTEPGRTLGVGAHCPSAARMREARFASSVLDKCAANICDEKGVMHGNDICERNDDQFLISS